MKPYEIRSLGFPLIFPQHGQVQVAVSKAPPGLLHGKTVHFFTGYFGYLLRITLLILGILLVRELFFGSVVGLLGLSVVSLTTLLAGIGHDQNNALQSHSNKIEEQIKVFQTTNTQLKKRVSELAAQMMTLKAQVISLHILQETLGNHIQQIAGLENAIRAREEALSKLTKRQADLISQLDEGFGGHLDKLEKLTDRIERNTTS